MKDCIVINGIETHNLKNIDITLRKKKLNLIIGPSGSGKSSLAYDTIAQIGQHELLSMFADNISEPTYKVKSFENMVTAVPIKQSNHNNNTRSTIGTYFGLNHSIGMIYATLLEISDNVFVLNKENNLCPNCHGIGTVNVLDENRIINYNIPLNKNPFRCWNRYKDFYLEILEKYCSDCGIDVNKTFKELSKEEKKRLLFDESLNKYSIRYKKINAFTRRTTRYYGVMTGKTMLVNHSIGSKYYSETICPECKGKKYSKEHNEYKIMGLSIGDFMTTPFRELSKVIDKIYQDNKNDRISFTINLVKSFIDKSIELNLGHLFFHRTIPTLSGGELQRLRMVQVFNTQLSDLLIVLDEPLAGLSGREKVFLYKNIIKLLKKHTVVVVDHSEMFIEASSNIIALGERGGNAGGYIINSDNYIKDQRQENYINVPEVKNEIKIIIDNDIYRYKGVDIKFAKDCMNLITGQSGVGKSTLLREYFPQFFDEYVYVNQKPMMGNKNSSVASALDISGQISSLFAKKFSKDKKFFSNLTGSKGVCPICQGAGFIEYGSDKKMLTKLECQECDGTGFNKELKKYMIDGKSIFDIWQMTVEDAIIYYKNKDKKIFSILKKALFLMLGHLRIGQATTSLSGGENIRIKILKSSKKKAMFVGVDEPFKGLNQQEIYRVATYLDDLRKTGKTIFVIDHTLGVEKYFSKKINIKTKNDILISR